MAVNLWDPVLVLFAEEHAVCLQQTGIGGSQANSLQREWNLTNIFR
jgi:hypothetical protein